MPRETTVDLIDQVMKKWNRDADIISPDVLIENAKDLKSEDGENNEYDRALVELSMRCLGLTNDCYKDVATLIGVPNA